MALHRTQAWTTGRRPWGGVGMHGVQVLFKDLPRPQQSPFSPKSLHVGRCCSELGEAKIGSPPGEDAPSSRCSLSLPYNIFSCCREKAEKLPPASGWAPLHYPEKAASAHQVALVPTHKWGLHGRESHPGRPHRGGPQCCKNQKTHNLLQRREKYLKEMVKNTQAGNQYNSQGLT